jgi:hypothetical protein
VGLRTPSGCRQACEPSNRERNLGWETYGPRPIHLVVKEQRLVPLEGAYALEGITVVPLEQEVAAPFAMPQLADHGARDEGGRRAA